MSDFLTKSAVLREHMVTIEKVDNHYGLSNKICSSLMANVDSTSGTASQLQVPGFPIHCEQLYLEELAKSSQPSLLCLPTPHSALHLPAQWNDWKQCAEAIRR